MSVETLEPGLTKADKRVLAAVSPCGDDEWRFRELGEAVTVWQIAEALNTIDIQDVVLTLRGLAHLGYVCWLPSESRKRDVYWRTLKGDEAVASWK
jgi:hypothetical protein